MNSKLYKTCRICLKTDNQLISFDSIMNYVPIKKMVTKILKYKVRLLIVFIFLSEYTSII